MEASIVHWHFSAFKGVPNRHVGEICIEGVLPWNSSLAEPKYVKALNLANEFNSRCNCIFEVTEQNYSERTNGSAMLTWSRNILQFSESNTEVI